MFFCSKMGYSKVAAQSYVFGTALTALSIQEKVSCLGWARTREILRWFCYIVPMGHTPRHGVVVLLKRTTSTWLGSST